MTKNITDILRPFLAVLFIFGFGSLIGCGGGGGNTAAGNPMTPMTMTMTPPPPMTMTAEPLAFTAPELGGVHYRNGTQHFIVVLSLSAAMENTMVFGNAVNLQRQTVIRAPDGNGFTFEPQINRVSLSADGVIVPLVENGNTVFAVGFANEAAFETRPTITAFVELCPVSWISTYINARRFGTEDGGQAIVCPAAAGMSYTPNMPNVLHAAMADTFHRGIGIGESRLAFSGRHNGNDRAAGFTYDMGGYALRTDYVHLPSKQDSGVWLDTYRFGIMPYINDETRFFAGVDSYRNAILALDINAKNQHRFGIALGEGYAVQYELRVRL